jgi:hypothetical protein
MSISEVPVAAADSVSQVLEKIRAYVASCQALAADGITVSEFAEMAVGLLRVSMAAVESIPIDGPSKKAWVLDAVAMLFDGVADKVIPTVAWPVWLLVRPAVRSLVLAAAGGAVEAILPILVRTR